MPPPSRQPTIQTLIDTAAAYQTASVIPHCPQCAQPCCRLESLVLDLEWKQVKVLWNLTQSRTAFDKQLAQGEGPKEIRERHGRYYAHQKPCPAYGDNGACRIYDQPLKPAGCSDFPVYEDGGDVIADLRCEAVNLDALIARLSEAIGPGFQVKAFPDREFPFLVTLVLRPTEERQRRKRK